MNRVSKSKTKDTSEPELKPRWADPKVPAVFVPPVPCSHVLRREEGGREAAYHLSVERISPFPNSLLEQNYYLNYQVTQCVLTSKDLILASRVYLTINRL